MPQTRRIHIIETKPSLWYPVRIAIIAALGGFMFGFDIAVINGAIIAVQKKFSFAASGMWISVSPMLIGAGLGAFFGGKLANTYGQRLCLILSGWIFFIGAFALGYPFFIYDFIFWRMVCGFAIGMANVVIPRYIAETSPPNLRGTLGALQQLAIVLGISFAMLSNFLLVRHSGGAQNVLWLDLETWRWMFWSSCIPSFIYVSLAFTLPESPRFLVMKNKLPQARRILAKLISSVRVNAKINDIKKTITVGADIKIANLFAKTPRGTIRLYPAVIAGFTIACLQQLTGINVIFYYGNALWQSLGFRENQSLTIGIIIASINLLMTAIAVYLIDLKGRKKLLIFGSIGMFIGWTAMAIILSSIPSGHIIPREINAIGISAVAAACVCVISFSVSWGPVAWVMLGEMFNNNIRGTAIALAGLLQWLANFIVCTTFHPLLSAMGASVYGIYACMALFGFFFVLASVQETAGKELEEM